MGSLALIARAAGHRVTGCDAGVYPPMSTQLEEQGIALIEGFEADQLSLKPDLFVIGNVVTRGNPLMEAILDAGLPYTSGPQWLGEHVLQDQHVLAVAGTHGKTTTTSLLASVLAEGGLDPTFVIGGKLNSAGANARLGTGDFIVAEADESDASFLNLLPVIEVITNIDADHMDTYQHDMARLKNAFVQFTQRMPFYGIAVLCVDDANVRDILPFVSRPVLRYGLSEGADVRATDVKAVGAQMQFTAHRHAVRRHGAQPGSLTITLNLPGLHNVRNALAAIAIATELGVSDEAIVKALAEFRGVGRRFQKYGEIKLPQGGTCTVVDDYGHHPVEMAATIAATRGAYPGRRLLLAFQPHRFTRTRDCFGDFVKVLQGVDALALTEVYPAGEARIPGADSESLIKALSKAKDAGRLLDGQAIELAKDVATLPELVLSMAKDGDVIITMGAGSISAVPGKLVERAHV